MRKTWPQRALAWQDQRVLRSSHHRGAGTGGRGRRNANNPFATLLGASSLDSLKNALTETSENGLTVSQGLHPAKVALTEA